MKSQFLSASYRKRKRTVTSYIINLKLVTLSDSHLSIICIQTFRLLCRAAGETELIVESNFTFAQMTHSRNVQDVLSTLNVYTDYIYVFSRYTEFSSQIRRELSSIWGYAAVILRKSRKRLRLFRHKSLTHKCPLLPCRFFIDHHIGDFWYG